MWGVLGGTLGCEEVERWSCGKLPEGKVRYEVIVESRSRRRMRSLGRAVMPCGDLLFFCRGFPGGSGEVMPDMPLYH